MIYQKILILEAPWSDDIADTRATKEIYSSPETLLSIHPEPVGIIQRPLVSSTYLDDIDKFVALPCNQRGPNLVIISAHGTHSFVKRKGDMKHRREIEAFDRKINISTDIRALNGKLGRTIFILDACEIGIRVESFRKASGALGTIGFAKRVDWIDSSVFILSLLLYLQQAGIFHLQRARKKTGVTQPRAQTVFEAMISGSYRSLAESLDVKHSFGA